MTAGRLELEVDGRRYAWPDQPLVVVCIDDSESAYIEQALNHVAERDGQA